MFAIYTDLKTEQQERMTITKRETWLQTFSICVKSLINHDLEIGST